MFDASNMLLKLMHFFDKNKVHGVLFPEAIIVVEGWIVVVGGVRFVQVVTEIKGVFEFFQLGDFVDDYGFNVGDPVVELGLFLVRVYLSFKVFLSHYILSQSIIG